MIRHRWHVSPRQAVALQRRLAGSVIVRPLKGPVRMVAGADCAFVGRDQIVAAAVLCDAATMEVLDWCCVRKPLAFPYVPGLLSFREAPAVIEAVKRLSRRPDLLLIDGQGLAHPRAFGIACHVGLWLDMPAIGVAKSRLCGEHEPVGRPRGSRAPLRFRDNQVGLVLRTRDGVKPVYVSVGHRLTLRQAAGWVLRAATRYRLPEPTRKAHQYVTRHKATLTP